MTIQTQHGGRATATTTPCCAAGATFCATRTSARSSCRGSRPASSTRSQRGRRRRRQLPLHARRSASTAFSRGRSRPASTAARCPARARSSGTTTSCTRSTRCSASATTFRDDIGFIKRQRHPQALRRLRHPLPARVVAEVRDPRAASAHALQHLHGPVEREGVAHQSRGDGVVLRDAAATSSCSGTRASSGSWRRSRSGRISRSRPAAMAGTSTPLELETNHSRKVSGSALITTGGFWNGTQKSIEGRASSTGRRIT